MKIRKAGDMLSGIVSKLANEKSLALLQDWEDIIGEDCVSHSRIRDLKKQVLLIEVDHPAWLMHMHQHQEQYLRRLKKRHATIRNIHFIISSQPRRSPPLSPPPPLKRPISKPSEAAPPVQELHKRFQHISELINNQENSKQ